MYQVDWADFKTYINSIGVYPQYIVVNDTYIMRVLNGGFEIGCEVKKTSPASSDQTDFETNFQSKCNKPAAVYVQAFGSKILQNGKKLYARNTGIQQALSAGANTISYTMTYAWAKMVGVEVINAEALDYVDLKVKDNASGTYSGVPNYVLNQFAYSHNIPKDYYIRMAQFDADLYVGMVIEVTYNSVSAKTVGLNFILNEVKD